MSIKDLKIEDLCDYKFDFEYYDGDNRDATELCGLCTEPVSQGEAMLRDGEYFHPECLESK